MRTILSFILLLGLIASSCRSVAAAGATFKFELVRQISPDEIWHSNLKSIPSAGVSILYLDFDRESAAKNNEWLAQGIIMGGLGDLDSKPIAIRLWSRKPAHLDVQISSALSVKNGSATAVLDVDGSSCLLNDECPSTRFVFTVTSEGKVIVNGKLIGQVE